MAEVFLRDLHRWQDLRQLEHDVVTDISQMVTRDDLKCITFFFDNRLLPSDSCMIIDMTIVKECLRSLPSDQRRTFDAYEKVDPLSRGVGLGLTVASKIAVLYEQEHKGLPKRYYLTQSFDCSRTTSQFVGHYEYSGFVPSQGSSGSLNVCDFSQNEQQRYAHLTSLDPSSLKTCLVLFFEGPLFTTRLEEILKQADKEHECASAPLCPLEIICGPTNEACQ
ncbi:hypothetical protein K490DRAFT_59425 [Saccharata proteae CBS 121410]|uniref:Uncharacterized protein n=1 Tax=Saccharata proteae CBS 121410 TaxID=1314787 RepID=A0A9P4HPM6_9PEZI|nr:hypothetical protein K490DRAFT_59425 [Saccharata proteae CBS 121410]